MAIFRIENGYFHAEIHINYSCTHMLVHMLAPPRKLGKCGAVWCVLVYILIRVCLEKLTYFYIKK